MVDLECMPRNADSIALSMGGPNVCSKILLSGRQEAHIQRRLFDKRSRGQSDVVASQEMWAASGS